MRELGISLLSAREALRSRFAIVIGLLVVGGGAALCFGVSGDGSAAGRLRTFLSWGAGLGWLLLSLAAVFLSTSFGRALMDGRLTALCLAPLDRVRVLLAWWGGVAAVLLGLSALTVATLGLLAGASWLTAGEVSRPALRQVLQARGVCRAPPQDLDRLRARIEEQIAARAAAGTLPEELTLERAVEVELERELLRRRTVGPGRTQEWRLSGVQPAPGAETVTLRFYFFVQDQGRVLPPGRGPRTRWELLPEGTGTFYDLDGSWPGVTGMLLKKHELTIPVALLEGRDSLTIRFRNLEEEAVSVLFPELGPELLYPAGSFLPNLVRAGVILWARLLFLCALGVCASALLDPKLAALVVLFFLLVGTAHEFLVDALRPAYDAWGPTVGPPMRLFLKGVLAAIPDLSREDLATRLAEGELLPGPSVALAVLGDGVGRGGAVLIGGALLFARRELGAARGV